MLEGDPAGTAFVSTHVDGSQVHVASVRIEMGNSLFIRVKEIVEEVSAAGRSAADLVSQLEESFPPVIEELGFPAIYQRASLSCGSIEHEPLL